MASIKDVARSAGVGLGTVSRVLNNTGYVAQETRDKIEKAMQELNYIPNELARNLLKNKTGIVGIIIPDIDHPFFSAFCKYAEMELYNAGYKTMICSVVEIGNREQEYLDMLERNMVDGIITGAHTLDNEAYKKINKPIVAFDRDLGSNIPLISSDHVQGGILAANKLIENGCKKVMGITEAAFKDSPSTDRHKAFSRVIKEHNVDLIVLETAWNNFNFDYFYETMDKYVKMCPDIDGIFAADITAICCSNILQDMGKRVPEDVKIIGYDATAITKMARPMLTAVKQNIEGLASASVSTLLKKINGEEIKKQRQVFSVELQIGRTTM